MSSTSSSFNPFLYGPKDPSINEYDVAELQNPEKTENQTSTKDITNNHPSSRTVSYGISAQLRSIYVVNGTPAYCLRQDDLRSRSRVISKEIQHSKVKQREFISGTAPYANLVTGNTSLAHTLTLSIFVSDIPEKYRKSSDLARLFGTFLNAIQSWLRLEDAPPSVLEHAAYDVFSKLSEMSVFAPQSVQNRTQFEIESAYGVASIETAASARNKINFKETLSLVRQLITLKSTFLPEGTTITAGVNQDKNFIDDDVLMSSMQGHLGGKTTTASNKSPQSQSKKNALFGDDLLYSTPLATSEIYNGFGADWYSTTTSTSPSPVLSTLVTPSFFTFSKSDATSSTSFASTSNEVDLARHNIHLTESTDNKSSKASSTKPRHNFEWLVKECESLAQFGEDGSVLLAEETIAESVVQLLKSNSSDDALQSDLCDLLGFEKIDVVAECIKERQILRLIDIAKELARLRDRSRSLTSNKKQSTGAGSVNTSGGKSSSSGGVGVSITVTTKAEIEEEKRAKRIERRLARRGGTTITTNEDRRLAKARAKFQLNSLASGECKALSELQQIFGVSTAAASSFAGINLPEGSTRTKHKLGWEEVFIPPPEKHDKDEAEMQGIDAETAEALKLFEGSGSSSTSSTPYTSDGSAPTPRSSKVQLVPISAFSEIVQPALFGIKSLNALQSRVFECAYNSSSNMLVCAPTGAGKTNVALTTVLREIERCTVDGIVQKNLLKIVYVAPMKALAQEVAGKFAERLAPLGLVVRELTGDMQLSKSEIAETQLIVTTPEKWDVVTRKAGDGSLLEIIRLLILDEVHLLHEERGPVLEVLVARTHRYVETAQRAVRIVGLSATVPNPRDVAAFLGVPSNGLFIFGPEFRPVPLAQTYIGINETNPVRRIVKMNECAYEKTVESLRAGNQVMIFVHSRKETVKVAEYLIQEAKNRNETDLFSCRDVDGYKSSLQEIGRLVGRSNECMSNYQEGVAVHHAGLGRPERNFVEQHYHRGLISVLICTATLAWGVNLPAHTVIIKGTQLYDPSVGGWTDVGMLDIMQIFGRAGRPQFDTSGEAFLITSNDKLPHYLTLLTSQLPIESQMIKSLPNHINAEIILGTISSLREAEVWLTYTYLYARMLRNPIVYGIPLEDITVDPSLHMRRNELVRNALKELMACKMIKYDGRSGNIYPTDAGRVAALYYIDYQTISIFHTYLRHASPEILGLVARSKEFAQLKLRQEEMGDLEKLLKKVCPIPVKDQLADGTSAKANILLQSYISRAHIAGSSLGSDMYFIQQSAGRVARALFELTLRQGNAILAGRFLLLCKNIEQRLWSHQHPLRQIPSIKSAWIAQLEHRDIGLDRLSTLHSDEVKRLCNVDQKTATKIIDAMYFIPWLSVRAVAQPLTRDVLRITVFVKADFQWNMKLHGMAETFWIWVESAENTAIYQHEQWTLTREMARTKRRPTGHDDDDDDDENTTSTQLEDEDEHKVIFTIPIFEPIPSQYIIRISSDRWLGSDMSIPVNLQNLALPSTQPVHTPLLPLIPLPVSALANPAAERLYSGRFTHFNPVQTQVFHAMYHSDSSALVCAPTGSGKTVIAELALLRALYLSGVTEKGDEPKDGTDNDPDADDALATASSKIPLAHRRKIVYIAPMKALARERVEDWGSPRSLAGILGLNIVELTGDVSPSARDLANADILVTTPEKWDGVSREWRSRSFVACTVLLIIDEIHLLGQDRGPVLEVIVSRMRCIAASLSTNIRVIGLSTALSNAHDLGDWLGVEPLGMFNFPPAVRPVPLSIYVSGYPGKHYCPRMALMNKPVYAAITTHSPDKPTLVFVSSRRQTRLTGIDLVALTTASGMPRRWVTITEDEMEWYCSKVQDPSLQHLLTYGIGMHHAGLSPGDRSIVEELFLHRKILVLICTSTLAWGVNFPAHLVVVKGTEYFDAKTSRYVDFPITDVLQMIGRAGRPQFDTSAKACILVHEPKKPFYHKFLHSPFPVESSLHEQLHDHIGAEIASGTIAALPDALDWISWTFFYRRLLANPTYYGLVDTTPGAVNAFLITMLARVLQDLQESNCISITYENDNTSTDSSGAIVMNPETKARAMEIAKMLHLEAYSPEGGANPNMNKDGDSSSSSIVLSEEQLQMLAELDRNLSMLVQPTSLGSLASFYYLSHKTIRLLCERLSPTSTIYDIFWAVCCADEFTNLPVRHNEDKHNENMIPSLEWKMNTAMAGTPYGKTSILLQARWQRLPLPVSDYATDLKLVLDQSARLLLAMVDICADAGWLQATMQSAALVQSIVQGRWLWDQPFANLPSGTTERVISTMNALGIEHLAQLIEFDMDCIVQVLTQTSGMLNKDAYKYVLHSNNIRHIRISGAPLSQQRALEFVRKVMILPRVSMKIHGLLPDYDSEYSTSTSSAVEAEERRLAEEKSYEYTSTRINRGRENLYDGKSTTREINTPIYNVQPGSIETISLGFCRLNGWIPNSSLKSLRDQEIPRILGPSDVKMIKEGWWALIGQEESDELMALARVNVGILPRNITLKISVPNTPNSRVKCTAYLLSDCYIGFDQQYDFILQIGDGSGSYVGQKTTFTLEDGEYDPQEQENDDYDAFMKSNVSKYYT